MRETESPVRLLPRTLVHLRRRLGGGTVLHSAQVCRLPLHEPGPELSLGLEHSHQSQRNDVLLAVARKLAIKVQQIYVGATESDG